MSHTEHDIEMGAFDDSCRKKLCSEDVLSVDDTETQLGAFTPDIVARPTSTLRLKPALVREFHKPTPIVAKPTQNKVAITIQPKLSSIQQTLEASHYIAKKKAALEKKLNQTHTDSDDDYLTLQDRKKKALLIKQGKYYKPLRPKPQPAKQTASITLKEEGNLSLSKIGIV